MKRTTYAVHKDLSDPTNGSFTRVHVIFPKMKVFICMYRKVISLLSAQKGHQSLLAAF